jgi:hypothetical protein
VIVLGLVGFGKSATVKAIARRLKAVYGDHGYLAIVDPKGEYGPLAACGGTSACSPVGSGRSSISSTTRC